MHISSTAVPKDVVEKKEKIAEIHLYKDRHKEKYKCSPDKQDVHSGWREEEGEEEQG